MTAKELREKYARQVDLAFFRRNVEVDSVDLSAMLDMAEIAEEFYENCRLDGRYVSPKEVSQMLVTMSADLAALRANAARCRSWVPKEPPVDKPIQLYPNVRDNGPEIPDFSRGGDGPAAPSCDGCHRNHWGQCS